MNTMYGTMDLEKQSRVAVVGLGLMGITAVKNLLEAGFDVTGFERSGYIGGLWHFTDDPETLSVLETTQVNINVDMAAYTDFPFPDGTPKFCSAQDVQSYIEKYVDHFGFRHHLRLNSAIERVVREEPLAKWRLDMKGAPSEYFDKIIMATGPHLQPLMPSIPGAELFEGKILHSKAFKRPKEFTDENVIVVGMGHTGVDVTDALIGHAASISISHNSGAIVIPREFDGQPLTSTVTHRIIIILGLLEAWFPRLAEWLLNRKFRQMMTMAFGPSEPAWLLDKQPSAAVKLPVVSDTLISHLRSGAAQSVPGIRRITGSRQVELADGRILLADAIICCTGYSNAFDLIDPIFDPSRDPPASWHKSPGSRGRPLSRLYQGIFSPLAPDSLAFLGCVFVPIGACSLSDICSMCIAQVWTGRSSLPPIDEMNRSMDAQQERICRLSRRGPVVPASMARREWLVWADGTARTGIEERLGWGWKGWRFWWRERRLYRLLMDGVVTPAIWRLFDGGEGGRKRWEGAGEQIVKMNAKIDDSR